MLLTVWITTNCRKFFKRWEYQTTWAASWEICMQDRKQQLELDMEQQTSSKSWKEHIKAVYCDIVYLCYTQSTSWEMLGWSISCNQDFWEIYQLPPIWSRHHPYCRKWRITKEPPDESERGEWKSWLKTQHSENYDHGFWSHGDQETVTNFIFWGFKIVAD